MPLPTPVAGAGSSTRPAPPPDCTIRTSFQSLMSARWVGSATMRCSGSRVPGSIGWFVISDETDRPPPARRRERGRRFGRGRGPLRKRGLRRLPTAPRGSESETGTWHGLSASRGLLDLPEGEGSLVGGFAPPRQRTASFRPACAGRPTIAGSPRSVERRPTLSGTLTPEA